MEVTKSKQAEAKTTSQKLRWNQKQHQNVHLFQRESFLLLMTLVFFWGGGAVLVKSGQIYIL